MPRARRSAVGTFARDAFSVTRGHLAEYRSAPAVLRGFCAQCGTSLTYRNERRAAEIDVTLASLDDPARSHQRCTCG